MTAVYEHPEVDPLRVIRLTPSQIRRLLILIDDHWTLMDTERRAMSPREQQTVLARQQEIEGIQETLRRAL